MSLFGREVAVEIGPEGGVGVRLADLRVGFRVEHKSGGTPSTATVRIWNPAPASIGLLRVPLAAVRLFAGYTGLSRLLFQGPPIKGGLNLRVEGPDRILEVDAADGGRAYASAFLQTSFATGSTFGQVIAAVLAASQWARGFIDPTVESVSLPHGLVLTGRPAEIMARVAAAAPPAGADWFVRDNALYVVARGQKTPDVAPLISSLQGNLIGSPTVTTSGVRVRALIDATMRPGRSFVVEAQGVSGEFVARDVTFQGDSGWESDFYMDLEGRPLGVP